MDAHQTRRPAGEDLDSSHPSSSDLHVSWQLVYRLVRSWERLRARSGATVSFGLRDGVRLAELSRVPPQVLQRLSPAVVASLLVHNGQVDGGDGGAGLLFAGARLLSLEEIVAVGTDSSIAEVDLPLSTTVGFHTLAVRPDTNGQVVMRAGFNTHVKAPHWAAFLDHILVDTV